MIIVRFRLTIECTEDEGMRYRAAASDLMVQGNLAPQCLRLCTSVLSNTTETPLRFRMISQEPFQIVQIDPVTNMPVMQILRTDMMVIKPRQNAKVTIDYHPSNTTRNLIERQSSFKKASTKLKRLWINQIISHFIPLFCFV